MIPPASINLDALRARKSLAIDTEPPVGVIAQIEGVPSAYTPKPLAGWQSTLAFADGPPGESDHAHIVAKRLYGDGAMASQAMIVDHYAIQTWRENWLAASSIPTPRPTWHTAQPIVACCAWAMDEAGGLGTVIGNRIASITRDGVAVVCGTPSTTHPGNTIPSATPECIVAGTAGQVCDLTVPVSLSSWSVPVVAGAYYLLHREAASNPATQGDPCSRKPEVIRACLLAGRRHDRSLDIDMADRVLCAGRRGFGETVPQFGWSRGTVIDITIPTGAATIQLAVTWTRDTTIAEHGDGKVLITAHDSLVTVEIGGIEQVLTRPGVLSREVEPGGHVVSVSSTGNHPITVAWRVEPSGDSGQLPAPEGATLGGLLNAWGTDDATHDLNQDGTVDGADLGIMLQGWTPPTQEPNE